MSGPIEHLGHTFRDEKDFAMYCHCRDNLFPTIRRLKKVAQQRLAARKAAEQQAQHGGQEDEKTHS